MAVIGASTRQTNRPSRQNPRAARAESARRAGRCRAVRGQNPRAARILSTDNAQYALSRRRRAAVSDASRRVSSARNAPSDVDVSSAAGVRGLRSAFWLFF